MKASTKNRRRKHQETFLAARIALYAAGCATAAFGVVVGWWEPNPSIQSVAMMIATALSAAVVPFTVELVGRSRISFLLLAPAMVFGAINAYSVHHAYQKGVETPARAAWEQENLAAPRAVYAAAVNATAAHAVPVYPSTMPAMRVRENTKAWQLAHAALIEAEARAKAAVDAVPAYEPAVAEWIVVLISTVLDASLALGLAGIAGLRVNLAAKAKAERKAASDARRKAKATADKAKAPAGVIRSLPRTLKLVANEN